MSISLKDLKVGDTLYCARRRGSQVKDVAEYLIVEIVLSESFKDSKAKVSINGQPAQFLSFERLARLRRDRPVILVNNLNQRRVSSEKRLRKGWVPVEEKALKISEEEPIS